MTPLPRLSDIGRRASVLAGVLLALLLAAPFDGPIARAVHDAPAGVVRVGVVVSRIGLSWYMIVLSVVLAVAAVRAARRAADPRAARRAMRLAERAIFFVAVIAGSGIVCQIIKHLVGRARPRFIERLGTLYFDGPNVHSGLDGFPSGHTTTMFAAAVALSLLAPAWRLAFFALAILVGCARVLAEAHYLSDVVGGAALGATVASVMAEAFVARGLLSLRGVRSPAIDGGGAGTGYRQGGIRR